MGHEITGRYTEVLNTRAYYDICGEGIPLICIHMGWACSLQWYKFMPIMADAGFKVIAPDLPGHAKSMPLIGNLFEKCPSTPNGYGSSYRLFVPVKNRSFAEVG